MGKNWIEMSYIILFEIITILDQIVESVYIASVYISLYNFSSAYFYTQYFSTIPCFSVFKKT